MIESEDYKYDYRAQKYLVQLLADPNERVRNIAESRLKEILNFYWQEIEIFDQQEVLRSAYGELTLSLIEKEGIYGPLLYRDFSNMLKDSSNDLQIRMTVLEFLKLICAIESSRLQFMDEIVNLDPSNKKTERFLEKVRAVKNRAESAIRGIQKTLMDVIARENEISFHLIIASIEFLGAIAIFNHGARVLLEDISEDESIFNRIRQSVQEALNQMEANKEDQQSGTE